MIEFNGLALEKKGSSMKLHCVGCELDMIDMNFIYLFFS